MTIYNAIQVYPLTTREKFFLLHLMEYDRSIVYHAMLC